MQDMRWLTLLLGFAALAIGLPAADVSVLTWNLKWFPSGSQRPAPEDEERRNIAAVGGALRKANADIIVLQEVRGLEVATQLAQQIDKDYSVLVCSAFTDSRGGAPTWQQIAIISRMPAQMAWAERWKTFGVVDPPRGFSFAAIQIGPSLLGVYGVHLKSNLHANEPKLHQLNILKRELAIEQLLEHRRTVEQKAGQGLATVIIAGDFNTSLDDLRFASEGTIRTLLSHRYSCGFEGAPLEERITIPASGGYAAATFDYVFVRGGTWNLKPRVLPFELSDHRPVFASITLGE